MKVAVISNINIDLLNKKLSNKNHIYQQDGYGTWMNDLLNEKSKLYEFNPEAIFILLDGEELFRNQGNIQKIREQIDEIISYLEINIKWHEKVSYFISNIDIPLNKIKSLKDIRDERYIESYWLDNLYRLNQKYDNFYVFDMKNIIENMGRNHFYSMKSWYLAGIKTSIRALESISNEINKILEALQGKKKKCLILDMDNTLWGGVVGECGVEGIELSEFKEGARYKDFQKRIKEIKNLGVILAICSKNNYEDAIEVLRNHENAVLKEDDFIIKKVNWKSKSENIKEISNELNIGLDSFVFIDDSRFEREGIKELIPDIIVPEFPQDTSDLNKFITDIYYDYFYTLKTTKEDKEKTELYKANIERNYELKIANSFEDYLKKLNTKVKIWKARKEDVSRISQLTQKTNQFNVTTKRYMDKDINNFITSDKYEVYVASVEDKFGDNGKVIVMIFNKKDNKTVEIDTFLMSCRVMGRYIEDEILAFMEEKFVGKGFEKIIASYYATRKNRPVENLFERLGYQVIEEDEKHNKKYSKKLPFKQRKKIMELVMI
ncbi:HAD-IIIC family phosphatase [Clostridium sporogenes]|uniref:HAD-IIIC family phosphatase n=1 Tax=Clostridium sporogenes TaxID=1509 RepID=UPI0022385C53|nr:HAD-IIIC family phosphatase [Clostridium sporogenes]MCW6077020.1 HAD-IIIC family phosphatase [Clostridium sporogenes]